MGKWWDAFVVAVKAKHSISVHDLLRAPTENNPRQAALINNMNEQAAERKVVSFLFLSLGSAGRKNLTDRHPFMVISTATLTKMRENCEQIFRKQRNRTLERYKFFSRKQQNNETLRQFWNALRGLAARCDFDNQTESLIMDAFIQNMHNKTVQERLCTEPKENTQEALRFAVPFEEGISQQKSFMGSNDIKKEPIFAIDNKRKNPCTRCGMEFVQNHLTICKAKKEKCRNCGIIGHFMRMCKRPKTANFRGTGRSSNGGGLRRVNLIGQAADQSEGSSAWKHGTKTTWC